MAKKVTRKDFTAMAEFIINEFQRRKNKRKDLEKIWKDIDRQIAMEPDLSHKLDASGDPDEYSAWMPEIELPGQAQTLEILTADSRRMLFPDSGPWFTAHASVTDEYLEKAELQPIITGDDAEVPTLVTQDSVDKLAAGVLEHYHRQYDFEGNIDLINAEAFKYGMGIGRGRVVTKQVFRHTSKGVVKDSQKIPALIPRSIKNTYLDDSEHHLMNEGYIVGPGVIFEKTMKMVDIKMAANKGSNDPDLENGGWMPAMIKTMEGDDKGDVQLLEWEGDIVVPRKTGDLYLPNVIVTVVLGQKGKETLNSIVRFRKNKHGKIFLFPYHYEHLDNPYATAPLMKGYPIQKAAVDALNRTIMSGALDAQPPTGYDRDDQEFANSGGPRIYPGASWPTTGDIKVYSIGNPSALFQIYIGLLQQYADVTGVNASRLGAQTVSHTTAFAKEAELSRGTIRTVDYVKSSLKGPLEQWLDFEYGIARELANHSIYIEAYGGFVEVSKDVLPKEVIFEAYGSGGPAEVQAKAQAKLNSLQMAIQLDNVNVQQGGQPVIDIEQAIEQILREGGWRNTDVIKRIESPITGAEGQAGMEGSLEGTEGSLATSLQALGVGGQ